MSGICAGQKIHYPARVQGGGLLRGCVSAFSGGNTALWAGILGEQGEPLRPGRILLYLCGDVLCRHVVPYGGYGAHGSGFSEPQPHADLPADPVSGCGDRDPDRAAIAARHMAVRHPAVGVVLYLLQRDVEPAGRPDRTFEPEQLPEPHRRDAPQRRGAGGVRCGQLQTDQRPLRPFAGRCLPCRDRRLHQKSLCPLRVLLPYRRR